ncbi:MAG TPA: hypothetical protein VFQ35_20010, partial [Polyangiaceae bacterium]|nr:hypothetical protein [Polyangiaceae bacterium]
MTLNAVRVGQTFSPEIARRALDELADQGRYGDMRVTVEPRGNGVALRLHVVARRVIVGIRISGVEGDPDDLLRAANVRTGNELLATELPDLALRVKRELIRHGYPYALVNIGTLDTDDPLGVVLTIGVERSAPERISARNFAVWPDPKAQGMGKLLGTFGVRVGDRADLDRVEAEAEALEERLRAAGFHEARVQHTIERGARGTVLNLQIYAGLRTRIQFEGHRHFDVAELEAALDVANNQDRAPSALAERIRVFYVARGFLDAAVDVR